MDLYLVLGVRHSASEADIRRAYRRLARRYHPDINPGDREAALRFQDIVEAYETLVDPDRRHRYDAGARGPGDREPKASGFDGFDFSKGPAGGEGLFGDLFAEVLSVRRRATEAAPERGVDLHQTITLGFTEALQGARRPILVTRRDTCAACAGRGHVPSPGGPCRACDGKGTVRVARGHMVFRRACASCAGSGRLPPRPCLSCGGAGLETRSETTTVAIPPGIADGDRMRVPGKGNVGPRGGAPGDLYLTAEVTGDARYRREGDDVVMVLPVAVPEAALGARVEVETPDGPARLRVPPGTQSGQRFRLRERGAPSVRDGRRGDLIVEVRLMLPRVLDERSKALLREFASLHPESVRDDGKPQGGSA
ncbi:MAG: J domain-containing protein [Acidimicrobiia bacterium]|nr:J domain-containing protein [Acidimicrobiia bacterium]